MLAAGSVGDNSACGRRKRPKGHAWDTTWSQVVATTWLQSPPLCSTRLGGAWRRWSKAKERISPHAWLADALPEVGQVRRAVPSRRAQARRRACQRGRCPCGVHRLRRGHGARGPCRRVYVDVGHRGRRRLRRRRGEWLLLRERLRGALQRRQLAGLTDWSLAAVQRSDDDDRLGYDRIRDAAGR